MAGKARRKVTMMMRRWGSYPNGLVYASGRDAVMVEYWATPSYGAQTILLSRADARLLAKRINEYLDGTVK